MSVLELELTLDSLEQELAEGRQRLDEGGPDARLVWEQCQRLRQLGCGLLLADLDVDGFQHCLYGSARLYLWLLEQQPRCPDLEPYYLCKSQALPLLDALAIAQFDLARSMGQRLTTPCSPHMEVEEDYHYFDLLAGALLERRGHEAKLEAFERARGWEYSPRYDVVAALVRQEPESFWEELALLTREWRKEVQVQRRSEGLAPAAAHTEAQLFLEGLALARLGEHWGLPRPRRLAWLPAEAFLPPSVPFTAP